MVRRLGFLEYRVEFVVSVTTVWRTLRRCHVHCTCSETSYIERFHRPEGSDASGQVNLVDAVLDSKPADRTSWEAARESAQEVQLALRSQEMTPGLDKSPGPLRGVWRTRPQTPWGLPETA